MPPRRYLFVTSTEKYKQPSRYSPAIAATNRRLHDYAEGQQRVTYVDCNDLLLEASSQVLRSTCVISPSFFDSACRSVRRRGKQGTIPKTA
jgi:hypothetical protein